MLIGEIECSPGGIIARLQILFIVLMATACSSSPEKVSGPLIDLDIDEPTRLIQQAGHGNEEEVKKLLSAGEKVDQANPQGITALMVAARKGNIGVMQIL